jgi:hypothetical protein
MGRKASYDGSDSDYSGGEEWGGGAKPRKQRASKAAAKNKVASAIRAGQASTGGGRSRPTNNQLL